MSKSSRDPSETLRWNNLRAQGWEIVQATDASPGNKPLLWSKQKPDSGSEVKLLTKYCCGENQKAQKLTMERNSCEDCSILAFRLGKISSSLRFHLLSAPVILLLSAAHAASARKKKFPRDGGEGKKSKKALQCFSLARSGHIFRRL